MGISGWLRTRRERGAALLEMALVTILLFTLLFGIVGYGYLLSFRGSMQQSASEGARAAAPAPRTIVPVSGTNPGGRDNSDALARASAATQRAVQGYDKSCGTEITCQYVVHDCALQALAGNDTPALPDCITVSLHFDNTGSNALLPMPPLIASVMPDELSTTSTVELNFQ